MGVLATIAAGASIAGGVAKVAGALGGGGDNTTTQQRFISEEQAGLLRNARGRFDRSTQDLNQRAIATADASAKGLGFLERGELDAASKSLISQNVDRNRRLQSARQASLASQFGAGSTLSGVLGRQGALRADLALNQQTFGAFRDQLGRQGALDASRTSQLNQRNVGVQGFRQGLQAQQATARLTGGTTTTTPQKTDTLGAIGDLAGTIGAGFAPGGAFGGKVTPNRSDLIDVGGGNSLSREFLAQGFLK
jgi:hypothetical protein